MSLRNKTHLIILVMTVLFLLIVYGLIWRTTTNELESLQRAHAEEQLLLVNRILEREVNSLSLKQADWAQWDDTYRFIADRNEEYIASNLNDESFRLIDVDIMAFVNNSSEIVYGKQVYPGAPGERSIPESLLKYLQAGSELLDFSGDLTSVRRGILTAPDAVLIVSAQPISTSDGKGVRRGVLVFARYIDTEYAEALSVLSGLGVQLVPYGFASTGDDRQPESLRSDARTAVEYIGGKIVAFRLLDNVFGNASLLLRIEYLPRIIDQGESFLLKGLWYSLFALVSYVSLLVVVIDFFLLRRIEKMRRIARQVSVLRTGALPEGDIDDFSYLSTIMMDAIKDIERSNNQAIGSRGELAKFQMALDQSFDHMIITDAEGKILYANAAAEHLTGYSREEMIGQTPGLWGRQMPDAFYRDFWKTIRLHKEVFAGEVINKNKSGARYRALIRVTPILNESKQVLYFIGVERFVGNG